MADLPTSFIRRSSGALVAAVLALVAAAQRPAHYGPPTAELDHARELFGQAKYGAAQYELDRLAERVADHYDPQRIEAEYLAAICAVRLFNEDAVFRMLAFMRDHPEDQHVPTVRYELFRHYFSMKRWDDCLVWAELVNADELSGKDQEEYHFKKGYALFQEERIEEAMTEMGRVKDGNGPYAVPATYYTAHMDYGRGRYATALAGFEKIKGDPSFGRIVPFYIAEIQFREGHYEEVIAYVEPLLADPSGTRRIGELNRLVGQSHYQLQHYEEAAPFLEKAVQRSAGIGREERYMLGYTYYRSGDWQKALTQLSLVTNEVDSLAQLAVYHMADCYLHLNEKNYARNAFKRAYELGQDPKVTEDALFNYAKLAYELSFDPYNEAITALRDYLRKYPNTPRRNEAYGFLVNVFLKTRNYAAALSALDEIKDKDLRLKEVYQQLAFNRGVELYDGNKFDQAADAFQAGLKYPVDRDMNARCHFWMGESYYHQGDLDHALRKYDDLRNTPGAYATTLYEEAGYSMGYAYFKQKVYDEALTAFRRFQGVGGVDPKQRSDAMMRIADCYYLAKDEEQAIRWYDEAIRAGSADGDYALFQKGVCYGLERRFPEKIAVLKDLLAKRPNSRFAADAKFQLGETYINLDDDANAMRYYTEVVQDHPNSPNVRQSMLQVALVHKRQGDPEKALQDFKAIVAKYPTMDGARDALAGIESIYVEQGRVGEYETYLRSLDFVDPANLDLDEKYYRSAEALYFDDKCEQAIGAFGDYLSKYPNGAYALNALFYRGDCEYRAKRYDRALPDLEAVIERNGQQFLGSALFGASDILFKDGRWEGALAHFARLEQVTDLPQNVLAAKVGQMRCLRELGRMDEAAEAAQKVVTDKDASADLQAEAGLLIARAALDHDSLEDAYARFKVVDNASTNAIGAEARFNMAYVRFLQERYRDAEKEVFGLVQAYPAYDHWKARSFILLGDVYVRLDDRFQAKATLQSVVDHCTEPDLVQQARSRLDTILASEVQQTAPPQQEEITVPLPDGQRNDNGNDR
ncbi:MAG: tetratricopeptide repeat protein [Flavobacteriales bacterium]|nr:tetratricopeptide repeat protein [Flavobacteriales bacterium]MCB9167679.1 tetratricopeptide repeat protein [Flavobacteriales bacterium]